MLGIRDYARKCGFRKVLLGLSGGIDSALTAAIAADALGPENVLGVHDAVALFEPGQRRRFRGAGAEPGHRDADAADRAASCRPTTRRWPTRSRGLAPDVTEENIQARIRGNLLMALSNKFGALLLTTGNKSELAVGYCTLYGDMSGGLAVIADVPKTMVYRVSRWRNDAGRTFPKRSSPRRRRRSCGPTRPIRTGCRRTRCSTRFWSGTSSSRSRREEIIAQVSTKRRSAACCGWCGSRSSSGSRRRRG